MTKISRESNSPSTPASTLTWQGDVDGYLELIDQTKLPLSFEILECRNVESVWQAIKRLSVRGAPAIGVSAAYGVVIGMQSAAGVNQDEFDSQLQKVTDYLASSRPTAVNLFWALDRMKQVAGGSQNLSSQDRLKLLLAEAKAIDAEDRLMCNQIGKNGAELLSDGMGVLTHCNAGALATAGDGTALSVFYAAKASGKNIHVYADETRPLLQGARLTTWELMQRDIPVTLICDSMAGWVMKEGRIQCVVTGADRIAGNGDAANKIGTYSVALLAKAHNIPFYVAAPSSTFDFKLKTGEEIPIEERASEEITCGFGTQTAPDDVSTYNPAFDVTPASYIDALITEKGIIQPVTADRIQEVLAK